MHADRTDLNDCDGKTASFSVTGSGSKLYLFLSAEGSQYEKNVKRLEGGP